MAAHCKKYRTYVYLATMGALIVCGLACQGGVNVPAPPTDETVSFADDIQPIFDARCTECHRAGSPTNEIAGIRMILTADDSYDSLVDQTSSQRAELTLVTPDDPDASLLWLKVSSNRPPVGATMPLFGERLSSEELGLLRDWIAQGAMDN